MRVGNVPHLQQTKRREKLPKQKAKPEQKTVAEKKADEAPDRTPVIAPQPVARTVRRAKIAA